MKMLEKLQKRLQEGKKDNKGFSLVELIIVIAIMAILVGIVGMTVIPQIENARKATDEQVLSALCTEAMEAYTQALHGVGTITVVLTVDKDTNKIDVKKATINGTAGDELAAGTDAKKFYDMFVSLSSERTVKSNAGKKLIKDDSESTKATCIIIKCDGSSTTEAPVYLTAGPDFQKIEVR